MAPKKRQRPSASFIPYLPPSTPRRERELQNAEVRSVAASYATRLSEIETEMERKAAASPMEQSETAESSEEASTQASNVRQSVSDVRTAVTTSFPSESPYDRLLIDNCTPLLSLPRPLIDGHQTSGFYC